MTEAAGRTAVDPAGPWWRRHLPLLLLLLTCLVYLGNVLLWVSRSEVWLHTDGHIHFFRVQEYARALFGDLALGEMRQLFGYGPLIYFVTAVAFHLLGESYTSAVVAQCLFGLAGGVGAFLCGRRLAGPWAGLLAALALLTLPMFLVRTWDVMADMPMAALSCLALGLVLASDGLRRWGYAVGAGLALGAALMTKWPSIFGLGPAFALAIAHALYRDRGLLKGALVGTAGAALVGLALAGWYFYVPSVLSMGTCLAAGVVCGVATFALVTAGRRAPGQRVPLNMMALLCAAAVVAVPLMVFGKDGLLHQVQTLSTVQMELLQNPVDRPDAAGMFTSLVRVWLRWELGPVLALLLVVGLVVGLVRRESRLATSTLLVFFVFQTGMVLLAMDMPAERHLLSAMVGLSPLASAWLFWPRLPVVARRVAPALAALWFLAHGVGWLIPGMPGARSPMAWHKDIQIYGETEPAWLPAWAGASSPMLTLLPYSNPGRVELAARLVAKLGVGETCGVFIIHPAARNKFDHMQELDGLLGEAVRRGSRLAVIDALDQPGAALAEFDFWLVLEPPGEAALAARLVKVLGKDRVTVGWTGAFQKFQLSAVWYGTAPKREACQARLSRYELLPLGEGFRRTIDSKDPALPRELVKP